jgi:Tfp pilus assembly protein PilP
MAGWLAGPWSAPAAHAAVTDGEEPQQHDQSPPYDPAGKRDPFQPQAKPAGPPTSDGPRTPLQQFELSQLKLVAVITESGNPQGARAVVEDSAGLGYIIRIDTAIGRNDGRVTAIEPDRIVIEEWPVNVFGERRKTVVVKQLDAGEEATQ